MKKVRISLLCSLLCGVFAVFLSSCGVFAPVGSEHQHIEKAPVRENEIPATCITEGSYDEVVYCKTCDEELSRTTKTVEIDADAHTPDEPIFENETPATCLSAGYRDEVTKCADCEVELKRVVLSIEKLNHDGIENGACTACGVEVAENGIEYKLNDDSLGYTLVSVGSFSGTELVIDSFNSLPVTKIGARAFCKNEALTTLSIPTSVTSVELAAFLNCTALASVSYGGTESEWKGVHIAGYNSALTSAEFSFKEPTTPETPPIPDNACNEGLSFSINPDRQSYTLTGVGSCLDSSIVITTYKGLPVTKIASHAFSEADHITDVLIGKSVESIGEMAFEKCYAMQLITFEEGSNLKSIGKEAFFLCDELRTVNLPDSVESISELAFVMCHNLQTVVLGESLTSIGANAFFGCYKLVEIINNSSLTLTNGDYNNGCVALYAIEVHSGSSKVEIINDFRFYSYNGAHHLLGYIGTETDLTLPASYKGENYMIHDFAFYSKDQLTRVEFPSTVTHIGEGAFMWCTSLTSVDMVAVDKITVIADEAFYGCANLEFVEIPNSVVTISLKAFDKCIKLNELRLGTGVREIGVSAFAECPLLQTIVCYAPWDSITIAEGNDCLLAAKAQALSLE